MQNKNKNKEISRFWELKYLASCDRDLSPTNMKRVLATVSAGLSASEARIVLTTLECTAPQRPRSEVQATTSCCCCC